MRPPRSLSAAFVAVLVSLLVAACAAEQRAVEVARAELPAVEHFAEAFGEACTTVETDVPMLGPVCLADHELVRFLAALDRASQAGAPVAPVAIDRPGETSTAALVATSIRHTVRRTRRPRACAPGSSSAPAPAL